MKLLRPCMVGSNTLAFVLNTFLLSFFTPDVAFSGHVDSFGISFGGSISTFCGWAMSAPA